MYNRQSNRDRQNSLELHDDQLVARAIQTLRELPAEDPVAVANIISAARSQSGADLIPNALGTRHRSMGWRGIGIGLAAVFVFGTGFVAGNIQSFILSGSAGSEHLDEAGGYELMPPDVHNFVYETPLATPVSSAGGDNFDPSPVEITFSFEAPAASNVAVVGDFNSWNPAAAPLLRRNEKSGDWTGTVSLPPGRHTYAFMVDGSIVPDPMAVNVRDPDYDVMVSTIVVKGGN